MSLIDVENLTLQFKNDEGLITAVDNVSFSLAPGEVPEIVHREHFYSLARIPGREEDAWKLAQELWERPINRDIPSVRLVYFALQYRFVAPADRRPLEEIFGPRGGGGLQNPVASRRNALNYLSYYWRRQREGFPMDGVEETIEQLLREFGIPGEASPLDPGPWSGYPPELFRPR